jgi:alpha-beta hydrolase superfamily lysophospholipase
MTSSNNTQFVSFTQLPISRYLRVLVCASLVSALVACGSVRSADHDARAASTSGAGSPAHEGELIRTWAPAPAVAGAQVQELTYWSVTPANNPIEVQARLYLPKGTAPEGGWPLAAFAHGTSGVTQHCGPTDSDPVLPPLLNHGIAVVATNYQGLGGPGVHPYADSDSQARDVLYSIRAARSAHAELSRNVALAGISQGGRAAEAAAELAGLVPEVKIIGNAMAVPALQLHLAEAIDNSALSTLQYLMLPYLMYGAHTRYPSLNYASLLHGQLLANADSIVNRCSSAIGDDPEMAKLARTWTPEDARFVSDAARRDFAKYFADGDLPRRGRTDIPVLITRGDHDTLVATKWTDHAVQAMCAKGITVQDRLRPGDHDDPTGIDVARIGTWVADRFANRPAPNTCTTTQDDGDGA